MPTRAAPRIDTKAFCGAQRSRTKATAIPKEEARSASLGEPAEVRRPKAAGAHPVRARENSIRDATYKAAFEAESAAVRTTKFMMWRAAGMFTWRKTETKGLSVTPAWFQGITPARTMMAPR